MASILKPGYLFWDGTKYVLNNAQGPSGTPGPAGATGPAGASFVVGGDLTGASGSQTVVGLHGHGVAATAPVSLAIPIWNGSQYSIRPLTADDIGPGFSITGFSYTGTAIIEIGTVVTNPSFIASYTSTPTSATVTNSDLVAPNPLSPFSTPFTAANYTASTFNHTTVASVTFTLSNQQRMLII